MTRPPARIARWAHNDHIILPSLDISFDVVPERFVQEIMALVATNVNARDFHSELFTRCFGKGAYTTTQHSFYVILILLA